MRIFFSLFVLTAATSCSPKTAEHPDVSKELDNFFSQNFRADAPGGAVLVIINDSIVFSKGYGLADIRTASLAQKEVNRLE